MHHELEPTSEELKYAEALWETTKDDAERGDPAGRYLWALLSNYYPYDSGKQVRLMGFVNEVTAKYAKGIPREEAWRLASKWDVEKMLAIELTDLLSET